MRTSFTQFLYFLAAAFMAIAFPLAVLASVPPGAQRVPLATSVDKALAQVEMAEDLRTLTVRGIASDDLRICVAPKAGRFGATRCFRVGDIRAGLVAAR